MAQAPLAEQKAVQDDHANGQNKQHDAQQSYSSWIKCLYRKKSAIELKPILNIFQSDKQCFVILQDVFGKNCVKFDNQQEKITLKTNELPCIYVMKQIKQQSTDGHKIEGSKYFLCFHCILIKKKKEQLNVIRECVASYFNILFNKYNNQINPTMVFRASFSFIICLNCVCYCVFYDL